VPSASSFLILLGVCYSNSEPQRRLLFRYCGLILVVATHSQLSLVKINLTHLLVESPFSTFSIRLFFSFLRLSSVGVKHAVLRRLNFELGIPEDFLSLDDLHLVSRIRYHSASSVVTVSGKTINFAENEGAAHIIISTALHFLLFRLLFLPSGLCALCAGSKRYPTSD
jgi:hypothetical protein